MKTLKKLILHISLIFTLCLLLQSVSIAAGTSTTTAKKATVSKATVIAQLNKQIKVQISSKTPNAALLNSSIVKLVALSIPKYFESVGNVYKNDIDNDKIPEIFAVYKAKANSKAYISALKWDKKSSKYVQIYSKTLSYVSEVQLTFKKFTKSAFNQLVISYKLGTKLGSIIVAYNNKFVEVYNNKADNLIFGDVNGDGRYDISEITFDKNNSDKVTTVVKVWTSKGFSVLKKSTLSIKAQAAQGIKDLNKNLQTIATKLKPSGYTSVEGYFADDLDNDMIPEICAVYKKGTSYKLVVFKMDSSNKTYTSIYSKDLTGATKVVLLYAEDVIYGGNREFISVIKDAANKQNLSIYSYANKKVTEILAEKADEFRLYDNDNDKKVELSELTVESDGSKTTVLKKWDGTALSEYKRETTKK